MMRTELNNFGKLDAIIAVWGFSYFFTVVIDPGLAENLSTVASAAAMAIMGFVLLASLVLDNRYLYGLLSLRATYGMVASFCMQTVWAVPYASGAAQVSMALLDFVIAIILMIKAIE